MPTLTASEKAALEGLTDEQLRNIVRRANFRAAHGLHMTAGFLEEADLARAALAMRGTNRRTNRCTQPT